ncbi:hypothetical protein [Ammoniphilus sp. 3BR4]|uniref:hypothetical protein n=1 Tax=Ammoniphilus sp. 3BR4 TaxID=3158265 RepID=UPI003465049E
MDHMYIRHTVGGRLFLDTQKHSLHYSLQYVDGFWKFIIDLPAEELADALLENRDELNIFVISEDTRSKSWYYTREGLVKYDDANHKLVILADFKLDYPA